MQDDSFFLCFVCMGVVSWRVVRPCVRVLRETNKVERLKGLQLKFTAFYRLLLECPDLADKVVLLQVCTVMLSV